MDPEFIPTPAQIEAACEAIQAEWSDDEKDRRRAKTSKPHVRCNYADVRRDAGSALVGKLARIRQAVA